jgi:hypothetical protein
VDRLVWRKELATVVRRTFERKTDLVEEEEEEVSIAATCITGLLIFNGRSSTAQAALLKWYSYTSSAALEIVSRHSYVRMKDR